MGKTTLPSYGTLVKELNDFAITPSEVHGIVCALICLMQSCSVNDVEAFFVKNKKNDKKLNELIEQLIAYTQLKVTSLDFDFKLVLPDEEVVLTERSEALGAWCQGFELALKNVEPDLSLLSTDSHDALEHIASIAEMDQNAVEIQEEDERAYVEVVEYLRMVVLMIYSEMNSISTGRTPSKRLH